ncbi:MAG: hypothetical protein Q3979_02235 [Actinomycetaceae bacterium]|nr:hypothetical protein [Actinomycetaceae bacterium]
MSESIWEDVLADVESQMDAQIREETLTEAAELRAAEEATIALVERIRAHGRAPLTLFLGGEPIEVRVVECATEWLYCEFAGTPCLIPARAIDAVRGLTRAAQSSRAVADSLSFGSAVRRFASGGYVNCHLRCGSLRGSLVRVGKDYIDIETVGGQVCVAQNSIMRVDLMAFDHEV